MLPWLFRPLPAFYKSCVRPLLSRPTPTATILSHISAVLCSSHIAFGGLVTAETTETRCEQGRDD